MRIALVTLGFSNDANDWCTPVLVEFVRKLTETVTVDIYTLIYPYHSREYRAHGARVFSFGIGFGGRVAHALNARRALASLRTNHEITPYNLVHAIWSTTPATVARKFGAHADVPYINTLFAGETACIPRINYGGFSTPRARRVIRKNIDRAARVTAGSGFLADTTERNMGFRPSVIPLGLNVRRFRADGPRAELEGEFPILIAGSVNRVKGHRLAIQALRSLAEGRPDQAGKIHLHIVGDEQDGGLLRQHLATSELIFPYTLHGGMAHHDMPAIYRGAALTLVPSRFESQCMVALESAACGTPVLGAAVGIIPDIAGQAFSFPAGDEEGLARKLAVIIDDRDALVRESAAQRAKAVRLANLDDAMASFLDLYENVACIKTPP